MFQTNYWEDGIDWNGLVFPATIKSIKPYTFRSVAIRDAKQYFGQPTGEVGFDLHFLAKASKTKIVRNLKEIDRIRKIDVPWIWYIVLFAIIMAGSIIACFFGLSMLRTSNSVLIPICVFFIIGIALAFIFVTMLSIQQEEVNDCYKLSELQNKIKSEQEAQLGLQRMNLLLNQMNQGRDVKDQDRCFVLKLNQLIAQSYRLMNGSKVSPTEMDQYLKLISIRMLESVFENAKFTNRLMNEIVKESDSVQAISAEKKLKLLRDTFQIHICVAFFADPDRFDYGQLGLIARDNLEELVSQMQKLLKSQSYRDLVKEASGLDLLQVTKALNFSKSAQKECLPALWLVYKNLVHKLPKREYKIVQNTEDMLEQVGDNNEKSYKF